MTRPSQKLSALLLLLVTMLLIGAATFLIARSPQAPEMDQGFVGYTFENGYPRLSSGISSVLLAGAVNRLVEGDETQHNTAVRIVAAALYLGAGVLLAWASLRRNKLLGSLLFLLFLFTSRYPFQWLSSDLFAGAFLMLYWWSLLSGHPFALRAIFLALFAFSKPDLLLPGLLVGLYDAISQVDDTGKSILRFSALRLATVAAIFALLLLPSFLNSQAGESGLAERSLLSFSQHYAALVEHHQIVPAPEPWRNARVYVAGTFGPVSNVLEAIRAEPSNYMDFVFLSASKSLRNTITSFLFFLLPPAILFWPSLRPQKLQVIMLLLLTNLIPILLLSFIHVRYMARFYPLALLIVFAGICQEPPNSYLRGWRRYALYAYLVLLLLLQSYMALRILPTGYWFYD